MVLSSSSRGDGIKNGEEQEHATAAMRSAGSRSLSAVEAGWERGGQEGVGDSARYALRRTPSEGTGEGKGEAIFPRKRLPRIVRGSIVKYHVHRISWIDTWILSWDCL